MADSLLTLPTDDPRRIDTDLDREPTPIPALPVDQLRCDDPWCPARIVTREQRAEHAADGCSACRHALAYPVLPPPCAYLELVVRQPHRHRPRGA